MANTTKRSDGRLVRTFYFEGKRYFVYGRSKKELDQKEREKLVKLESGKETRENPTFAEYYSLWTESRRESCSTATLRRQSSIFNTCSEIRISGTNKTLGQLKLSEITVDDMREVQRVLRKEKGVSTQTTNDYIFHISHVFKDAVKERRIDYNPCVLVKPLKRTEERARDTTHRALTKAETAAFLEAAKESFYYDVFRIAVNTGMRAGEIGALYVSDIRNDMINIERTITRLEDGSYIVGSNAKTEAGRRTIPVNNAIVEIVEHQKENNRLLDGDTVTDIHDRIFKAPERGLLLVAPLNREIKRICKKAGVDYFTMHAFRATFATRALEQGMNPRTLQEILGHTDFSMTMNLYGHVLNDTKKAAMQQLTIAV